MEITRADFESALPVGAACTAEVFTQCEDAIYESVDNCVENLLGDVGVAAARASQRLALTLKRFCCVAGFLDILRQLDLVLTPTGFGVVSNQNTAPASATRVDNLEKQLRLRYYKLKGMLVNSLRSVRGWGETEQARTAVTTLYNEHEYFGRDGLNTAADWVAAKDAIYAWHNVIREKIGGEMLEEFLADYRCKLFDGAILILQDSCFFYLNGQDRQAHASLRRAIDYMEDYPAAYGPYLNSQAYEVNHYEPYRNTKEATAFVFMG